ncbi:restriction endonuclease subunit S [Campylobacter sp. JMF_04 NA10]|uniref:restriction endonuclease subunit S n=1 Tax=Campylobacter sp. JMF_04 NA10 TaxID=2983824 RepID=UPI0022E9FC0E|nr:restriction endonuclease subunit S [Campylobacter sp. JMF_04 NA10]MDA3076823.1 restriction endonuclease subunit S [Campylobacter sp. JMF_04 NA10]
MITKENLRAVLAIMGFCESESNESEIWEKSYSNSNQIQVNFTDEKIHYPNDLKYGDTTTQNFSHLENFVVLECVDRLLSIGYKSANLELEPKWKLGHESKTSGKADIIVKDENEKIYLIIECKTFGGEFNKEKANMLRDGGQLFSYFTQDTNAKFICLYASDFANESIKREYFAVDMRDDERLSVDLLYKNANSVSEFFQVWCNTYGQDSFCNGIFEDNLTPYKIQEISLSIENLQELSHDDIQKKYHEFATILRQHNISGRENAFDKLLNLFLCKVIDEKENPKKLEFNYRGKRYDDIYDFCDRLQKLYQKGMKDFLNTEITYVSNDQINKAFRFVKKDPDATKEKINNLFTQLKYYTNNDFAFIEVYNKELFEKNSEILIKMVQMLRNIRLTTATHNQFLGDLFEGFLDSGVKQSEGQFFTPLPIVKFIISSLPIKELLSQNQEIKAIDYACGAGHFLNEYANYIKNFTTQDQQKELEKGIYGIEKETRLAKVSKVASFMYNQNINILGKDALSDISEIKKLKFDILIANPPYSVKGFLSTLSPSERQNYELSQIVGENTATNNAIECFFIERASQILAQNGVAGIIVPSSLINKNGEIYKKTREILLRNFKIIAVSEFGNKTFGQTGTNTVVLFLRKFSQNPSLYEAIKARSEHIFKGELNAVYDDESDLRKYCEFMDYDFDKFMEFIRLGEILENEIFSEYIAKIQKSGEYKTLSKKKSADLDKFIKDKILEIEKTKFIFFMLVCEQKTLITKSPSENKEQSKFLGYEWSNRKGSEGIKYLNLPSIDDEDELTETSKALQSINTTLYDPSENPNDENSLNSQKLNFWIRANFNGSFDTTKFSANLELQKYARYANLKDLIDFKKSEFDLAINLSTSSKVKIVSRYPLIKLKDICEMYQPKTITSNEIKENGDYKVYGANGVIGYYDKFNHEKSVIAMACRGATCGAINVTEPKSWVTGNAMVIIPFDENQLSEIFLKHILDNIDKNSIITGSAQPQITRTNLENLKIPLPPIDIQKQIVDECQSVDNEISTLNFEISEFQTEQSKIFDKFDIDKYSLVKLENKFNILIGGTPSRKEPKYFNGKNLWLSISEMNNNIIYDTKEKITDLAIENSNVKLIKKGTTLISFKLSIGKTAIAGQDLYTNEAIAGLIIKDEFKHEILDNFIFCLFTYFIKLDKDNFNAFGKSLNSKDLQNIKIPLPPLEVQEKIVAEFEKIENEISIRKEKLESLKGAYSEILDRYLK